jgi:hypothetical protein
MQHHNCIASLTAEVKMLRVNEQILKEEVTKQGEAIKELQVQLNLKSYVHEGIGCHECMMEPIRTDRFKCLTCESSDEGAASYNLCLYCYCRSAAASSTSAQHPKTHKFACLGPLGIVIVKESDVTYFQKRGHILKKEIFFKNVGEELELTVKPFKPQPAFHSISGGAGQ